MTTVNDPIPAPLSPAARERLANELVEMCRAIAQRCRNDAPLDYSPRWDILMPVAAQLLLVAKLDELAGVVDFHSNGAR